jgi:phosphoenolpyruvate carboxylase
MLAPRDQHLDQAWSLVLQMLQGSITLDDIASRIDAAALPALQARVAGLLGQLTSPDERANEERLEAAFAALAAGGNFDRYAALLGRELAGIVLTAHPTFSLSPEA